MHRGKAYGGKVLHNLQDTLKVPSHSIMLQFRECTGTYILSLTVQTLQHQSKGVADFESMQAVQYLSVQVREKVHVDRSTTLVRSTVY